MHVVLLPYIIPMHLSFYKPSAAEETILRSLVRAVVKQSELLRESRGGQSPRDV